MRGDKAQVADYIREHIEELAKLARGVDLDTLAYLLEIAAIEAERAVAATNGETSSEV